MKKQPVIIKWTEVGSVKIKSPSSRTQSIIIVTKEGETLKSARLPTQKFTTGFDEFRELVKLKKIEDTRLLWKI